MNASVRMAKSRLSEFLDRAAAGEEIVITSDGRPKARLVALDAAPVPYRVHRDLLRSTKRKAGTRAEVIIREDRDGRD
jgi:prevent-host-death family protein